MSEWVRVDQEMPKDGVDVQIYWIGLNGDRGQSVAWVNNGEWSISTPWCGSIMHPHIGHVTHWRSLGEPPR